MIRVKRVKFPDSHTTPARIPHDAHTDKFIKKKLTKKTEWNYPCGS
jgi:hypothetical protein